MRPAIFGRLFVKKIDEEKKKEEKKKQNREKHTHNKWNPNAPPSLRHRIYELANAVRRTISAFARKKKVKIKNRKKKENKSISAVYVYHRDG